MGDKSVKVMISIPQGLLDRVDVLADRSGLSRSAYIRDALRQQMLNQPDLDKRRRAVDALRRSFRGVELDMSPEEMIRAERDR